MDKLGICNIFSVGLEILVSEPILMPDGEAVDSVLRIGCNHDFPKASIKIPVDNRPQCLLHGKELRSVVGDAQFDGKPAHEIVRMTLAEEDAKGSEQGVLSVAGTGSIHSDDNGVEVNAFGLRVEMPSACVGADADGVLEGFVVDVDFGLEDSAMSAHPESCQHRVELRGGLRTLLMDL